MYSLRPATATDVPALLRLIEELAEYERAPHEVEMTEERLRRDGFGPQPLFGAEVVTHGGEVVGAAFYYFRYSTWKGKRLYLEDLIVTEKHRCRGLGRRLFERMTAVARQTDCRGMQFQVLEWNEPAIAFYRQMGVAFDGEWVNCSLTAAQIAAAGAE